MGGGNAQKSATARARADKNKPKAGGGGAAGAAARANPTGLKCDICFQAFPSNQVKAAQLHAEQKHPKETFAKCFPMCEETPAAAA
jgi:hypothetical protein